MIHPNPSPLDPAVRAALEPLYAALIAAVVVLARVMEKPCPVITRAERRRATSEEGRWRHE